MKKHILVMSIAATLSITNVSAETEGFRNLAHVGETIDNGFRKIVKAIESIKDLPEDTKVWTAVQVAELKDKICDKPITIVKIKEVPVEKIVEVIKEVPVDRIIEKIVYVDREVIKKIYIEPKERHCTTKRQSDRFGNVEEDIKCTEWKH
jgi:hypothetical protein